MGACCSENQRQGGRSNTLNSDEVVAAVNNTSNPSTPKVEKGPPGKTPKVSTKIWDDTVKSESGTQSPAGSKNGTKIKADFILNIMSCSNVPQADILQSESDPYIKFWIEKTGMEQNKTEIAATKANNENKEEKDEKNDIKEVVEEDDNIAQQICDSLKHSTPYRADCGNPVWNYVRRIEASSEDIIHFELWDKDFGSESQFLNNVLQISDDFLGECKIKVGKIPPKTPFTITFELLSKYAKKLEKRNNDKDAKCSLNFQLIPYDVAKYNRIEKTIIFIRHGEVKWTSLLIVICLVRICF